MDHEHTSGGLTDVQASAQLARDGPNLMPQGRRRSFARVAAGVFAQPMFLLLLAAALVYAVLGSVADAATLLASVVLVAVISIYQELRTERVLAALKDLASPRSRVRREGRVLHIGSHELVRGDTLLVAEGDRLACDARLVQALGLAVDESMLTGESVPVQNQPGRTPPSRVLPAPATQWMTGPSSAHQLAHGLQAGTLVGGGRRGGHRHRHRGVHRAGPHRQVAGQRGPAGQPRADRTEGRGARGGHCCSAHLRGCCCAVHGAPGASWIDGLLVGLTLAMAIVPEEFAVVWTVMMALGAWRLSRHQVLTRQPQAIEGLGHHECVVRGQDRHADPQPDGVVGPQHARRAADARAR